MMPRCSKFKNYAANLGFSPAFFSVITQKSQQQCDCVYMYSEMLQYMAVHYQVMQIMSFLTLVGSVFVR